MVVMMRRKQFCGVEGAAGVPGVIKAAAAFLERQTNEKKVACSFHLRCSG
jgi:hypothetical protein